MVYLFFLIKQRLFSSKFYHFMIKPFFVSFSVASIGELFDARLQGQGQNKVFRIKNTFTLPVFATARNVEG